MALSPVEKLPSMKSSIPVKVTFLFLFGPIVVLSAGCSSQQFVSAADTNSISPSEQVNDSGSSLKELTNSISMRFVLIPSGEFEMGVPDDGWGGADETVLLDIPSHKIRLAKPFYIGIFETTQSQFARLMGYNPSFHSPLGDGANEFRSVDTSSYPVENVSWNEAVIFCKRMSGLSDERAARRKYRLPTEAEWEYVCRSGGTQPYRLNPTRDPDDLSGENAGKWEGVLPIQQVGSYPPNSFGVYDMRGNVWEWCHDWYARDYYGHSEPLNPTGPTTGVLRIVRGSDWFFSGTERCRLTHSPMPPDHKNRFVGFRVVCEVQ